MAISAKRVLIYRLGSLGDTVVALPALHLVARAFPQAERRMLTNFPVNVKGSACRGYSRKHRTLFTATSATPQARATRWNCSRSGGRSSRWRPQVLVYLGAARGVESARRDAAFFRICGIRRLIGVPAYRGHAAEPLAGVRAGPRTGGRPPRPQSLRAGRRPAGRSRKLGSPPDPRRTRSRRRGAGPGGWPPHPLRQRRHQSSVQRLGPRKLARPSRRAGRPLSGLRPHPQRLARRERSQRVCRRRLARRLLTAPSSTSAAVLPRARAPPPSPAPGSSSATTAAPCTSPPPSRPPASPSSPPATSPASGFPMAASTASSTTRPTAGAAASKPAPSRRRSASPRSPSRRFSPRSNTCFLTDLRPTRLRVSHDRNYHGFFAENAMIMKGVEPKTCCQN